MDDRALRQATFRWLEEQTGRRRDRVNYGAVPASRHCRLKALIERFGPGRRTVTIYRPVGPKELAPIAASGWREFAPRLPGQPIIYPVTNEEYATQIARDWNVKAKGAGFVTRFEIDAYYLSRYGVEKVGGSIQTEYWISADDLPEFNRNIAGSIELTAEIR